MASTALAVKRALAHARHRSYAKPIIIRPVVKPVKHKRHHRGGGGGGVGGLMGKKRMGIAVGAAALGFIQKQNIAVPKLPLLGEAGTIGLIAYFLSNGGRNKLADDICTAAFAVAAYELGSTGTITGVGDNGYGGNVDTSGYVSGF